MADVQIWVPTIISIIFLVIILIFFLGRIQDSVEDKHLLATPNIPFENAVLTSMASVRIRASPKEVFDVVAKFPDFLDDTPISDYKWKVTDSEGVPEVGSIGTVKLAVRDFAVRLIPIKCSRLDRESMRVAERSTKYPKWILTSERVQEVAPVEGHPNACEYRTFQTLGGIMAYYLLLTAKEELALIQKSVAGDLKILIERQKYGGSLKGSEKQLTLDIPGPKRVTTM